MKSNRWFVFAVLAAIPVLPAFSSPQDSSYDKLGREKTTLVRYLPANPDNLNPTIYRDAYSKIILNYLVDSLYDYDNDNNFVLRPQLAESLPEISEDKKTFTIKLRKNAKWEDGTPVTAHDVELGYKLTIHPEVDSGQHKSYYADVEKYEAVDDHTVKITMKKVYAFYGNLLTLFTIAPRHIFGSMKEPKEVNAFKYPKGHPWEGTAYSLRPLSCGPYKMEKFEPQKEILLTYNDQYWGPKPEVTKVHFIVLTDTVASLQYLKRGDLDTFAFNVPRQWETDGKVNPYITGNFNPVLYYRTLYWFIGWNLSREVFKDKRVRQAMSKLLRADEILNKVELGHGKRCIGPYSAEFSQADKNIKPMTYDRKGAVALLDEAGWKDSDGDGIRDRNGAKFQFEFLMTSKNPRSEQIATVYQEDLKKVGIQLTIRQLEWNAMQEEVNNQKFDAIMYGWSSSDPEDDAYQVFHSSQSKDRGSNFVSYNNPKVDELIAAARVEFDLAKRNAICQEINRIIFDDQPYCFLWHPEIIAVIHKRFKTPRPSPLMGFDPRAGYAWKLVGEERK